MPKIRIAPISQNRLLRSLGTYSNELSEITKAINDQVSFVGAKLEDYLPKDLAYEQKITEQSIHIVRAFRERDRQLFGLEIPDNCLKTMTAALLLYKDDLLSRLDLVKSDALMPEGAGSPLEDELVALNQDLEFFSPYGQSDLLEELRARRERKAGLAYPTTVDLAEVIPEGEGQSIEFIEKFPEQGHEIAKEMAAFGTSNPGVILLGVANSGEILGLKDIGTAIELDKLRTRIEGLSSNAVIPSLPVRLRSIRIDEKDIAVVEVPKGPEPVYYTKNGVPYIRHGSLSRPALPQEVNELVKRHYS